MLVKCCCHLLLSMFNILSFKKCTKHSIIRHHSYCHYVNKIVINIVNIKLFKVFIDTDVDWSNYEQVSCYQKVFSCLRHCDQSENMSIVPLCPTLSLSSGDDCSRTVHCKIYYPAWIHFTMKIKKNAQNVNWMFAAVEI